MLGPRKIARDWLWIGSYGEEVGTARKRALAAVEAVADRHGFSVGEIMGEAKRAPLVRARHQAFAEVHRVNPGWSGSQVARFFNVDHSTVLSALKKLDRLRAWPPRKDAA